MGRRGAHGSKKGSDSSADFNKLGVSVYGKRWPALMRAMAQPTQHCAMLNTFTDTEVPEELSGSEAFVLHPSLRILKCVAAIGHRNYCLSSSLVRALWYQSRCGVVCMGMRPGPTVSASNHTSAKCAHLRAVTCCKIANQRSVGQSPCAAHGSVGSAERCLYAERHRAPYTRSRAQIPPRCCTISIGSMALLSCPCLH
jgi:hypothetical protein